MLGGVIARIGDPAALGLEVDLPGLRRVGHEADVVEAGALERFHVPSLSP